MPISVGEFLYEQVAGMSHDKSDSFSLLRYAVGGLFFLLALFVFGQLLSLLFIENVVDRAARSDGVARIPIYVRLVGIVATELPVPLNPNGSNWPFAFRVFFVLQMCGLAGLCGGSDSDRQWDYRSATQVGSPNRARS